MGCASGPPFRVYRVQRQQGSNRPDGLVADLPCARLLIAWFSHRPMMCLHAMPHCWHTGGQLQFPCLYGLPAGSRWPAIQQRRRVQAGDLDRGFDSWCCGCSFYSYLEGQGDLVSRLITPITHVVTLLIPIINLLTKSP